MDNNNNDNNNGGNNGAGDGGNNGAGAGGDGGFIYLHMAGNHEMRLWIPLGNSDFPLWSASVAYVKDFIADCNERIRWVEGRPRAYEKWLNIVIGFAAVWGVDLVPPDIVQSYDNVRAGVAGIDGIRAFGSLADEVAAR